MKLKKYRLNKNCIYPNEKLSLNLKMIMAAQLGYPFIKHDGCYYEVSINEYKTKPREMTIQMVDVEIVGNEPKGEIEVGN